MDTIGFVVTLRKDAWPEKAEAIKNAILLLQDVVDVRPIDSHPTSDYLAVIRAKEEFSKKLREIQQELWK